MGFGAISLVFKRASRACSPPTKKTFFRLMSLRHRMPELGRREYATRAELQSIADQTTESTAYMRLAETLTAFLARLRSSAETLDIIERQRVVRLLVKEILVSDDRIVIRHSIPLPTGPSGSHDPSPIGGYSSSASGKSYLFAFRE
jgi:site-specific DNA recombinase